MTPFPDENSSEDFVPTKKLKSWPLFTDLAYCHNFSRRETSGPSVFSYMAVVAPPEDSDYLRTRPLAVRKAKESSETLGNQWRVF